MFVGKARCGACHTPPLYTDLGFHRVRAGTQDPGRGKVDPARRGAFATPTLRGAANRTTLFHDASAHDLATAVALYVAAGSAAPALDEPPLDEAATGIQLDAKEQAQLVAFLRALSAPAAPVKAPSLLPPRRRGHRHAAGDAVTGGWRGKLEVAVGGVQLRALERAVGVLARVRARRTPDGAVAYLERCGSRGVPLAGIHGFGGDKETWLLVSALVDRRRGLALVDLPGHGRSADVPRTAGMARSARTPRRCCACSITPASTAP